MPLVHDLWAKGIQGSDLVGESLVAHTLCVVRGITQLRDRAPFLPKLCEDPRLWHRLVLSAAIHDLGKADPRFQIAVREKRQPGVRSSYDQRHEILSLAWLNWLLGDDPDGDALPIAAAVASHHRDHSDLRVKYATGSEHKPLPNISDLVTPVPPELFKQVADLFLSEILPVVQQAGLLEEDWIPPQPWVASEQDQSRAIESVRRHLDLWACWIEDVDADPSNTKERMQGFLLRGAIMLADHAGSAHEVFRSLPILSQPEEISNRLHPGSNAHYFSHQDEAADQTGHAILIAPTGSGKTEAAIRWAARQYETGTGSPPLFYVLPFKASMNAMHRRLIEKLTPELSSKSGWNDLITLQHSSAMQVLYHQLMSEDPSRSVKQAEWFVSQQKNLAKLHATPVRILSPFQLLRAAYQLKGHEALWTDAAGGVFIFDEIHAYDPVKFARVLEMLRFLVDRLGARVFVMTATMPTIIRDRIAAILGQPTLIRATDETFDKFRRHRLSLREEGLLEQPTIDEIVSRANRGDAVLCVTTTVGRAQELQQKLQNQLGNSCQIRLLHSRFTGEDRSSKEQELQRLVGTRLNGKRPEQVVLVATQVVEVSLDVDFDVLFTDPAPLDALVQRFGRINRSRRPEPCDVIVCTPIEDSQPVYNEWLVKAALDQLHRIETPLIIDERTIQEWLDEIYSGPVGQYLVKEIEKEMKTFRRSPINKLMPFDTNDDLEEEFFKQFDGREILPKSLVEEYRRRLETEPFSASLLTVPISQSQFKRLLGQGRIEQPSDHSLPSRSPSIVNVDYHPNSGLALNPPQEEETI
ncbi:MAG TPA: CRISPR-associated helicase Cas3' [Planctomicrobium sp.]|nr:CRISPR-associated helicase Cas3' [Planctomicrobium sp.]